MSTNIYSYIVLLLDSSKRHANSVMLIDSFVSFSIFQNQFLLPISEQLKLKYLLLRVTTECLVAMAVQVEFKKKNFPLVVFLRSVCQRQDLLEEIHVRGCIHAVNLWMSDNIGITIALCCAIGLPQVI